MGAKPLFFADYIAADKLRPEVVEQIVQSIGSCCRENDVIFVGGETAEMPSVYNEGKTDVAGFIGGVVEKNAVIDGKAISEGDVLIGLQSNGLHTNGYSLARKALFEMAGYKVNDYVAELKSKLADALLQPHRNYLKATAAVMKHYKIKGIAHITGGSFRKNLPRILPKGLAAEINKRSWQPQPIFKMVMKAGSISEEESYNTFNMGIGYVYVVSRADADNVMQLLQKMKETAHIIGTVVKGAGVRYVD